MGNGVGTRSALFLMLAASMAGCIAFQTGGDESAEVSQAGAEMVVDVQDLSEDARIYTIEGETGGQVYTRKEIEYERDGKTVKNVFYEDMVPALELIKNSTSEDSVFLLWWDYGATLEGYTNRESVIVGPSRATLKTVAKYAALSDDELALVECDCEPDEKVKDVALALVAENSTEASEIMRKYGAGYVLVRGENLEGIYAIATAAEKNPQDYIEAGRPTEKAHATVLGKMLKSQDLEGGLVIAYSDEAVTIYQLVD
jgi:hypothetical protein